MKPNVPVLSQPGVNWTGFISADSPSLVYIQDSLVVKDGKVSLSYTYTESIQGQKIIFKANPSNLLPGKIQLTQILPTTTVVTVAPNNNLAAFYCSEDVCNTKATLQSVVYASEGVSYAALLLSLLSCKIVGLELFGVLQLAFFTLSDYDSVNPLLASVLNRKEVNGFNQNIDLSAALSLSERVISNGFSS